MKSSRVALLLLATACSIAVKSFNTNQPPRSLACPNNSLNAVNGPDDSLLAAVTSGGIITALANPKLDEEWLLGGTFTGPGSAIIVSFLNNTNTLPVTCLPTDAAPFSLPAGAVNSIVTANSSTVFVGGDFIGDSGSSLVRLTATASNSAGSALVCDDAWIVDPTFHVALNGPVNTLLLADGILVVGGFFTIYQAEPAFGLVGLDPNSGARIF